VKPAIIVPAISAWVVEGRDFVRAVIDGEALEAAYAKKLIESRDDAQQRRITAGHFLIKVRGKLPRRSATNEGWKAFLEAIELDDSTAQRWMDAADPSRLTARSKDAQPGDSSSDDRPSPEPRDEDAPPAPAADREDDGTLAAPSSSPGPEVEIDRDTWCTPAEIAEYLGDWDLDPCANERSHIKAAREFRFEERGEDGLFFANRIDANTRVFINPPYSDVGPWIEAYAHTRFCFLLKLDPSTGWFERLFELSELILVPRGTRIQFEAPPGVPAEKSKANQFPHAFFYARASDATKAIRDFCFSPWRTK